MGKFKMRTENFEVAIKTASATKIEIELTFFEKELSEEEIRNIEWFIRTILEACGRASFDPARK